jgi:thiol-disulfide isomerase/thioredoxin
MKHAIKGFVAVLIFAGLLYLGWVRYEAFLTQGQRPPEGTRILNEMEKTGVPDFSLNDLSGKVVTLSDYKDKIVIVNFWASWCEPCVKEFPSLIRLLNTYPNDLVLLAISADYTLEDLTGFTKAFKVEKVPNFLVMWDEKQTVAEKYGTAVLPESYIIGPNLKLIRKVAGVEEWDTPMAIEFFKHLIDEK